MVLQGCLVTLCVDSSLHLWQLSVRDRESFIEEVRCLSAETRSSCFLVYCLYADVVHMNAVCKIEVLLSWW